MARFRILIIPALVILAACQDPSAQVKPTPQPAPIISGTEAAKTPVEEVSPTEMPQVRTAVPTPLQTQTQTPFPAFPDEHFISSIVGHKQFFPIGCEASTAVDWAAYYGIVINEFEFQYRLPLSDNPELGFVGGVEGPWGQVPPYSYGVHADPVANLLVEYGVGARSVRGMTLEELKAQVSGDNPVMVWVIGNVVGGIPFEYTDSHGSRVIVAAYEHTVIVTGYSTDRIRYMNNGRFYEAPADVFLNSWGVLGNLAVVRN